MFNNLRRKLFNVQKPNTLKDIPLDLISDKMGCDRGTPIDRVYIEDFLKKNKQLIKGDVMEIAESTYTDKYGKNINKSYIFTANKEDSAAIIGDLSTGEGCKEEFLDCFILTQTLPFIFDIRNSAKHIVQMLRPGGVALVTVRGISAISRYDESRWGDYWGFTKSSLKKLFTEFVPEDNIEIQTYGNAKTATCFLYGLCAEELDAEDFLIHDELIPVIITAVVKK